MKLLIVFMVAFALLMPYAAAQGYSNIFLDLSTDEISVCPCSTIDSVAVSITNNDDVTHTYSLSMELPEDWSGFIQPTTPALAPGESFPVEAFYITPSCSIKPGDYVVKITATDGSEEISKDLKVDILRCHNVEISTDQVKSACKGDAVDLSAEITNLGKIKETFEVSVTSSWGDEILSASFDLDSQESEPIEFTVTPPEKVDSHFVTINVKSKDSYAADSKDIRINVDNCYDFSASVEPDKTTACMGEQKDFSLVVKNLGTEADTYTLFGPDWITLENDELTLSPGESATVGMTADAPARGSNPFEIDVSSAGDVTLTNTATGTLEAEECRGVAVIMTPAEDKVCHSETAEFEVTVKNTGTVEDTFMISATGGVPDKNKVILDAGETEKVNIASDTKSAEAGSSMEVSVTAKTEDGKYSDSATSNLDIENCYSASLEVSPDQFGELCAGDEIAFDVVLENTGKFEDTYTLKMGDEVVDDIVLAPGEKSVYTKTASVKDNSTIDFVAESEFAEARKSYDLKTEPDEKCYSVSISDGNVRELDSSVGYGKTLTLTLKNTGIRSDTYSVILDAPEWIFQKVETVTLLPGSEKEIYTYVAPTYGVKFGTYDVILQAASDKASDEYGFKATVGTTESGEETGEVTEPGNVTINITLPTGEVVGGENNVSDGTLAERGRVILLAIIVVLIIVILAIKFIMFLK